MMEIVLPEAAVVMRTSLGKSWAAILGSGLALLLACGGPGGRGDASDAGIMSVGGGTETTAATGGTSATGPSLTTTGDGDGESGSPFGDLPKFDVGTDEDCINLQCNQVECADPAVTTTLSGTVYDPSATLPLYNVQVYIPNADVEPLVDELICDQCGAELSGSPLVSTVTDTHGRFVLEDVPADVDFSLVMQVGKWRRVVPIPAVQACQDNEILDPQVTRLPRSTAEGNLPRIALTTGSADPLFCLLRRLGIADDEYGIQGSDARIHFFEGSTGSTTYDGGFGASPGANFPVAENTLWTDGWQGYDIVMLSCEGDTYPGDKTGHRQALRDYLDVGGRAFATHYHFTWMQGDAPADLASIATFRPNYNDVNGTVDIDTSFPKGEALADWLEFVDGASPWGMFQVADGRDHTMSISPNAQRWVTYGPGEQILYFSFNAPIGAPEEDQCGRMVYSDIHVSISAGNPSGSFPSACNNSPLSEQEKVLIFMLFDLSGCITPDVPPG
jgi:hypothetical protein